MAESVLPSEWRRVGVHRGHDGAGGGGHSDGVCEASNRFDWMVYLFIYLCVFIHQFMYLIILYLYTCTQM